MTESNPDSLESNADEITRRIESECNLEQGTPARNGKYESPNNPTGGHRHWDANNRVYEFVYRSLNRNARVGFEKDSDGVSINPTRRTLVTYSEGSAGLSNLKGAINKLHNICRDIEDGYDPLMAVDEITKFLFIKLSEERSAHAGGNNRFSTSVMEQVCEGSDLTPAQWLNTLLKDNIRKSAGTFPYGAEDHVELSDESVRQMVEVLSNFSLLEEDADVKGIAYEELLNKVFRDTLGQYFTPREVVKFMVQLVSPNIDPDTGTMDKVVDPGVGSGGFLVATLEHYLETSSRNPKVHRQIPEYLYGIDRSPRMSKVATTNLMLHSDENWEPFSHIYQGNSLETDSNGIPVNSHDNENGFVPFGEFDILLANPPFGSKARKELAEGVTSNGDYSVDDDELDVHRETEALFLKRSVELLRPGGELAIVIPKNIIKGSGHRDLQKWLRKNTLIKSVVHLPLSTFRPFGSDVKTVVLHVQKRDDNLSQGPVYFDAARFVGYDATGREIPENDLGAIVNKFKSGENGDFDSVEVSPTSKSFGVFVSPEEFDAHFNDGGLDPLYYILDQSEINDQIKQGLEQGATDGSYQLKSLNTIATRRTEKIDKAHASMAYIIFASDIDRPLGEVTSLSLENGGDDGELGGYVVCQPGDVLYYRMRPYLRKAAVVPEKLTLETGEELNLSEVPLACSPEFCVLTVHSADPEKLGGYGDANLVPEYLWLILRSNLTLFQVLPTIKGGTRPRVPFSAIMDLEIPVPEIKIQEEAIQRYRDMQGEIERHRSRRQEVIDDFKQQHGSDLFDQLGMSEMRSLDDDVISLLIEADILPKSYHSEFY